MYILLSWNTIVDYSGHYFFFPFFLLRDIGDDVLYIKFTVRYFMYLIKYMK